MAWNLLQYSRQICRAKRLALDCSALIAMAMAVGCGRDQSEKPTAIVNSTAIASDASSSVSESHNSESHNSDSHPIGEQLPREAKAESRQVLVKVTVSGFKQSDGACRIAVYLGPKHFNDPEFAIAKESVEIRDQSASLAVTVDIPPSKAQGAQSDAEPIRLAVSAYHDQNGNSQLDKNSFGIPTELYGFSKNPKRGFGPPKFNEVAIEMNFPLMFNEPLDVPITVK